MRLSNTCLKNLSKFLEHYSKFNPSSLSIKQFIDFGRNKCENASFVFLRKELPVRLANIMQEIQLLPEHLLQMPSVTMVTGWYERSFEEILMFSDTNSNDTTNLSNFCETLVKIRNRHSTVVETMAHGILELKELHPIDQQTEHSIQYFLNRFYMSRISIRMLINQHAMLFGSDKPGHLRHVGGIDPRCDVNSVVQDAYENARFLCDQYYMASPDLIVEQIYEHPDSITIVYVPSHLYHTLFELFKNSMRAVVENAGDSNALPPIHVQIAKGKEDLTIKIMDRGGGIPRSLSELLFQYMYSTAPKPSVSDDGSAPLAGYGYGLPLSRLYARYLQGDLIINSVESFGTDAIVYLKVLSSEANELLPVFNKTSSKHYKEVRGNHDWSGFQSNHSSNMINSEPSFGVNFSN